MIATDVAHIASRASLSSRLRAHIPFRTLYGRLALVLLLLFVVVGTALILGALHFFSAYSQETTQRLNQRLAHHLLEQNQVIAADGYEPARLRALFDMQMAINPAIEIYLLDRDGRVVEYSAAPDRVRMTHVALGPIRRFLGNPERLPVLGDDPRNPGRQKIFSAAGLPRSQGYLYVVLANEQQDGIAGLLAGSYILRAAIGALVVGVLFATIVGLLVFALMTRRLEHLAQVMGDFQNTGFTVAPATLPAPAGAGADEIDRLAATFREMAIRMSNQLRELTQNDVLRRELVANVSHDLKTPLAALQGYVDTLLLKDASLGAEERRHYLLVASRSGERLAKLIADLIELAKLDAREITLSREGFPVAELMQDVMQKFQLKAEQKQLHLQVQLPCHSPFVCADIGLIERVLENLIGNAIAHTGPDGSVTLRLRADAAGATVEVADTGCGIPEEEIPRIFDRFYRVNDDQRARGDHAGLGLAITRSILELHDTRIEVSSSPGVGTAFRFVLPVVNAGSTECAK